MAFSDFRIYKRSNIVIVQVYSGKGHAIKKLDICFRMILNLLSTAYFHITILNRTAWFDIYKNISLCSQFVRPFFTFAEDFNVLSLGVLYLCKSITDAS